MRTTGDMTVQLGDLVAAAFDEATLYSANPREVSRLATRAVVHMLRRARETSLAPRRLRLLLEAAPE